MIYMQKTIRISAEKGELLDSIRKEKGISWNALADLAFEKLLETPTVEQDLSDAEIVAKKEDLEPAKPLNNEEKNGQDSGQITLDMSKLQLEAGGNNDDYI